MLPPPLQKKNDQCVQLVTDSLKYPQGHLFFNSIPKVPFPSVGYHDTRREPLLHVSYLSVYLQLVFPESNPPAKH